MKRLPLIVIVAGATLIAGRRLLAPGGQPRLGFAAIRRRMMQRMMQAMPEDSPPKLVKSILPRLKEQNDEILALLKEQSDILRRLNAER
jgi:hypothetical protein